MKVIIDGRMISWPGIGRYTQRLLQNLVLLNNDNSYLVLMQSADQELWQTNDPRFKVITADIRPYSIAEQVKLPRLLRSLKPDLVHFLHFTAPLTYREPFVVTIHDLILMRYQNLRGNVLRRTTYKMKRRIMNRIISSAAQRAKVIITDTQYVKDDLIKTLNLPHQKIKVTALASDPLTAKPEPIQQLNLTDQTILYVGSFFPYKNIDGLIEAMRILKTDHPKVRLILAGKIDSFGDLLRDKAVALGVHDQVIFTGFVPDEQLAWLYRHASLYAFPSLSEGFGLPGLEAMTAGLPVVSSNATCLPEVYGNAALYFDPLKAADIAAKLAQVLDNPKLQAKLRNAGQQRVKAFSWERMARQTLEVYKKSIDETI